MAQNNTSIDGQADPQMFMDRMEGTLLSVRDEGASSEFIVWFPFSKNAMKVLKEGILLTAKNYSSTDAEERLSVMQVTRAIPSHYALGIAGSEKLDAYPGFMDVAYNSVFSDLDKDLGDESTKILCRASPIYLEIKKPSSITSSGSVCSEISDETSIPMLGSVVNVLTTEWTEMVFNKDIRNAPNKIEIGTLANLVDVKISLLWQEMIRTHFGIFAYTNAGKSNLTSTYISKIFEQGEDAKSVIYDLQNEYGGLLIDVLCNVNNSSIIYTDEDTVDEAIMNYWREQNEENLNAAAEVLARTTILPKHLLEHRNSFVNPFKFLLFNKRIKLLSVDTSGTLGEILRRSKEELAEGIQGTSVQEFLDFMDDQINRLGNETKNNTSLTALMANIDGEIMNYETKYVGAEKQKTLKFAINSLKRQIQSIIDQVSSADPISDQFTITPETIRDSLNVRNIKSLYVFQGEEKSVRELSDDMGRMMMESRRRSGEIEPVVSFVYDEADQFIPQDTKGIPGSDQSKTRAVQIARRGRKYGIGIGIGTQRIVYLDTNVLGQPHTYFVSKLPRQSDRDKIKEAFGLSDRALDQTHRFKKGQWMLISHSATGIDGEPVIVTLPNANIRIQNFVTNYTLSSDVNHVNSN